MTTTPETKSTQFQTVLAYVLAYLLWAVSTVLGVFSLYLVREAYLITLVFSGSKRTGLSPEDLFRQTQQARAADQLSIFLLGILTIILIVFLEHYYRTAVPAGSLGIRFSLVTVIELTFLFLANSIYLYIENLIRPVLGKVIYVLTFEALLIGLFLWLWFYFKRKKAVAGQDLR